jgi:hypothetical protein
LGIIQIGQWNVDWTNIVVDGQLAQALKGDLVLILVSDTQKYLSFMIMIIHQEMNLF